MAKTVMCFGTFDTLHAGHDDYFRQARDHGDRLVVVVAGDTMVVDIKGDLPENNENDRLMQVEEHPLVDEAVLCGLEDKYKLIEELQPDVICLAFDQEAFEDDLDIELTRRGLACTIVRCEAFIPADTYKSSLLRGARITEDGYQAEEIDDEGIPL